MSYALFGGIDCFGRAVSIQHTPNPSAQQINAFFGVTGTTLIFGGGRGRTFLIKGVFLATDLASLAGCESALLSFDDGQARVLTDCWGRNWPYVVHSGQYNPDPMGPRPFDGGWGLPYRTMFRGLL